MLFRCLRSGNTVNIHQQDDIDRMMKYEGYEPVKEIQHEVQEASPPDEVPNEIPHEKEVLIKKKLGRPKKVM